MKMGKFRQYLPPFIDFFIPKEFEFDTIDELVQKYKDIINKDLCSNGEILCTDSGGRYFMLYVPKEDAWYVLGYVDNFNLLDCYVSYKELSERNKKGEL